MANKAQKRQSERFKEGKRRHEEMMKNLSPNDIAQLENYVVYQCLYINDAACAECEFLADKLKNMQYRSKQVRTIYEALIKRVKAYREKIDSTQMDKDSLYNLFNRLDENLERPFYKLRQSIEDVIVSSGVDHAEWVAAVESAYTMCDFAVKVTSQLIDKCAKYSKNIGKIRSILVIKEICDVAQSLSDIVAQIHVKDKEIDISKDKNARNALESVYDIFINPNNFLDAVNDADVQNAKDGTAPLMYDNSERIKKQ